MKFLTMKYAKIGVKTLAITPSVLLLGVFYADKSLDFLWLLLIGWLVAWICVLQFSKKIESLRHLFSILAIFIVDSLWGLLHMFPLPDLSHESPFLIAMIFLLMTIVMVAFISCCTFLYAKTEVFLLKHCMKYSA